MDLHSLIRRWDRATDAAPRLQETRRYFWALHLVNYCNLPLACSFWLAPLLGDHVIWRTAAQAKSVLCVVAVAQLACWLGLFVFIPAKADRVLKRRGQTF